MIVFTAGEKTGPATGQPPPVSTETAAALVSSSDNDPIGQNAPGKDGGEKDAGKKQKTEKERTYFPSCVPEGKHSSPRPWRLLYD